MSSPQSWWAAETGKEGERPAVAETGAEEQKPSSSPGETSKAEAATTDAPASPEELEAELTTVREALEAEKKAAAEAKDRLVRTLADMENLRERTQRQMVESKQFAVQSVVKSFLEVVDNLERAIESVPLSEVESEKSDVGVEKALQLLKRLHDGVVMTESIMLKLLEKEGVTRYDPLGQPFDPNLHNAMFNVPAQNAEQKPGHVAVVVKKGYLLHDRPVRAADVGVAQ